MTRTLTLLSALAAALAGAAAAADSSDAGLSGRVTTAAGTPVAGALVTARRAGGNTAVTVLTDAGGRYAVPGLAAGEYDVVARRHGHAPAPPRRVALGSSSASGDLVLDGGAAEPSSSAYLALLPEGEEKRRFALDCTGCHVFDERIAFPGGAPRTRESWHGAVSRMLGFAGAHTRFPVISAAREPAATAEWLAAGIHARPTPPPSLAGDLPGRAVLTEYDHPAAQDLPHDVAVDSEGQVVITGMFTHRMFRLDPATGAFAETPIPHPGANPRAVEIDPEGRWWVLLGGPNKIAVHTPATGEWRVHEIGMYPHSIGRDAHGRVWFNGHFTKDPEQIGYLDAAAGQVRTFQVPKHPTLAAAGGPVPYDLQVAGDGKVWMTELQGNRLVSFDPEAGRFETFDMPTPWSGPRRFDLDAGGVLWIPEYAGGALTRFDPATKRFRRYALPISDALPYVVRVDRARGRVWIGTGAADAVLRFDPATERFTVYPLPTRGALVRHLAVDPRTGDLWAAYGASPGIPPRILRVRVEG